MNEDLETDDVELEEYSFTPQILENGVIDYTNVEHDKLYLINKKNILSTQRPQWIPELDLEGLRSDAFLPVCVQAPDGTFYVQTKTFVKTEMNPLRGETTEVHIRKYGKVLTRSVFKSTLYRMSLDVLTATVDYYLKMQRAINERDGIKKKIQLPRRSHKIRQTRYDSMRMLFSYIPEFAKDPDLTMIHKIRGAGYRKQNSLIFQQFNDLTTSLKDKLLDMNLSKLDLINAHAKGEDTSYGNTNLSDVFVSEFGVKIKKQNGKSLNEIEQKRIKDDLCLTYSHFGNFAEKAKEYGLKISYADNVRQHARKAIGLFTPFYNAIGISYFSPDNPLAEKNQARATMIHEFSHWIDFLKGQEQHYNFASDITGSTEYIIAHKFKTLMDQNLRARKTENGILGNYWYRTCECFARAHEEYFMIKNNILLNQEDPAYLPKEQFIQEIAPLIESSITEIQKHFSLKEFEMMTEKKTSELEDYFKTGKRPKNDRFILPSAPMCLKVSGCNDTPITLSVSVVNKAYTTHNLSENEIIKSLNTLYDPVLIFDSDKEKTENKRESKLIFTNIFKGSKPIVLALNTNNEVNLIDSNIFTEAQDIRSIHDRSVIAKNGTDLIKQWAEKGLCRYVDDKKISEWNRLAGVQFPIELLQSDDGIIITKSDIVNGQTDFFDHDNTFKYKLLDRMRSDCDYYLNTGSENQFWSKTINKQIINMKLLYNSFKENEKPEWFSLEAIENLSSKMIERKRNEKIARTIANDLCDGATNDYIEELPSLAGLSSSVANNLGILNTKESTAITSEDWKAAAIGLVTEAMNSYANLFPERMEELGIPKESYQDLFKQNQETEDTILQNDTKITPDELRLVRSILPDSQYSTTLELSQVEEGEFFKTKIKELATIIRTAPKLYGTDKLDQHPVVIRYFHPSGTQSLVTELGENGKAFGYQVLNNDFEASEFGYLNLEEIKSIPGMEVDYHFPKDMTVERWLYQEAPEHFPNFARYAAQEKENTPTEILLTHLSEEDVSNLKKWGEADGRNILQIDCCFDEASFETEKGSLTLEEAEEILGREKILSGISRATFHTTAAQVADDGQTVYFKIKNRSYLQNLDLYDTAIEKGEEVVLKTNESTKSLTDSRISNYNIEESLQDLANEEAINESSESNIDQTRESNDNRTGHAGGSHSENVSELLDRSSSNMGGDLGRGHSGIGYGDSFFDGARDTQFDNNALSNNDSISDGHIWGGVVEDDSNASLGVLPSDLRERALEEGLFSHPVSSEQLGHGDERRAPGLKEQKAIRAEVKSLLETKTNSEFTEAEKELLRRYTGGGGLRENDTTAEETLNAFYTPKNIIKKTWELVDAYNPTGVTVLEPSSGIGRFAENRPSNKFTLREIDETSSRIAKILYPEAEVIQGAFQAQFFDENGIARLTDYKMPAYDIVIGNPPYGAYSGEWKGKGEGAEFSYIEEYFLTKGIESTKEGGVLAFIMPSGFLKRENVDLSETLTKEALLVDAWRLPNGAFDTTEVGTDIVVFKKLNSNEIANYPERAQALRSDTYFKQHPDHILGEVKTRSGRFGEVEYVAIPDGKTIDDMLSLIHPSNEQYYVRTTAESISIPTAQSVDDGKQEQGFSHVEKMYQKVLTPKSQNPFIDNEAFNTLYKIHPFKDEFESFGNWFWRSNHSLDSFVHIYFDIKTSCSAITVSDSHHDNRLLAVIDKNGMVTKMYDENADSYKNLSKSRKERLNELFQRYTGNYRSFANTTNLVEGYVGRKDDLLYFKNITLKTLRDPVIFFDSETGESVDVSAYRYALTNNSIREDLRHKDQYYGYEDFDVFYPIIDNLYPKNSKIDFNSVLEDDAAIQRAWSEEIPPLEDFSSYSHRLGLSDSDDAYNQYEVAQENIENKTIERATRLEKELLAKNGVNSFESLNDQVEQLHDAEHQKRMNYLAAKQAENMQTAEYDAMFAEMFTHGLSGEFVAGNSQISCVSDDTNAATINVWIDHEKAFAFNKDEKWLQTFNNYPVTEFFVQSFYDELGSLKVSDIEYKDQKLSLDKMISEKKFPKSVIEKGNQIADKIINDYIKPGFPQNPSNENLKKNFGLDFDDSVYTFSINGIQKDFLLKTSGTHIKLFVDRAANYPLFDFDRHSNILNLFQPSYTEGYITSFENVFKKSFTNVSVVKDLTIDNHRYVDTDGQTTKAQPIGRAYEPARTYLMNTEGFAKLYGEKWDPEDRTYWEATDYKGYVDTTKLSSVELLHLQHSDNYVQETTGKFIHKELFSSGNIYKKLKQNDVNFSTGLLNEDLYQRNKTILENAIPKILTIKEINQSVISPFVADFKFENGVPIKEAFLQWATGYNLEGSDNRRDYIADYTTANISRDDIPATISWSDITDYIDGIPLARISDNDRDSGEKNKIRNQKINDRKNTAEILFNRYLQLGLTQSQEERFVTAYNETFNAERAPDYSKLPLFIDGMNRFRKGVPFTLFEQQIKGISFLCNKGNGLLAYDVGVGKTAAGIVATVNQMQSGRCKRPLIVVPKSVIGKWESDIHELFPHITVNNLGNLSLSGQAGAFYDGDHGLNIPAGTITLITKDALNNIAWLKKTIDTELFADYADLLGVTEQLNGSESPRERALAKERIYQKAGVSSVVKSNNYILWEKTGFDNITVDEAHAYKNLFKVPRPKKGETNEFLAMGSGEPSSRALKMFNITQLIQKKNNNRNVFMLTATPFTNSALEVYSMLTYVARKELEENGIKNLYDFCRQYAKTRYEQVVTERGDVEYKSVMKEFGDLHGLQNIIRQYMDKVDGEEAGIIRPIKRTHAVHIKPTASQKEIFDYAIENIMTYKLNEGEKGAPTLEAMGILRTAALSPALIKAEKLDKWERLTDVPHGIVIPPLEEVVDCSPKLKLVCDTIVHNWQQNKTIGQVLYMPEGTDAFPHVINYMVKKGIPKEVFASIDGSSAKIGGKPVTITKSDDSDDKRAKVASCFNDPQNPCKILIGSSAISEGMDLNGNSAVLYNTMLGWNPTETIQVEGRIWRQGNLQGHVHIVYPLMDDSIDSLLYQKHDEKISRIGNLWSFKGNTLNVEDIDAESMKYDLIKDPRKRAKIEIQQEVEALKNNILMLENQLKDYDQLGESRIKFTEKLAQRKLDKQSYIDNHEESIAMGNPNRTEEEQKKGLERFDKSIHDFNEHLESIKRKYIALGIKNESEEHSFAVDILNKKDAIQKEITELSSDENVQSVIQKYQAKLEEEAIKQSEERLTHPLYEEIENDLIPMHIVEKQIKTERYNAALAEAVATNDLPLQEKLKEKYNAYLQEYNEKWGNNEANIHAVESVEEKTNNKANAHAVESVEEKTNNKANAHAVESVEEKTNNKANAHAVESVEEKTINSNQEDKIAVSITNNSQKTVLQPSLFPEFDQKLNKDVPSVSENKSFSTPVSILNNKDTTYPFIVFNNTEKERINIKFSTNYRTSYFNEIIKELKKNGWKYAPSTKTWYPVGKAVEKSNNFVQQLQITYAFNNQIGDISPTKNSSPSIYDNIQVFSKTYPEELSNYINNTIINQSTITEKQAKTLLTALEETTNYKIRIGIDEKGSLLLLEKTKEKTEKKYNLSIQDVITKIINSLHKENKELQQIENKIQHSQANEFLSEKITNIKKHRNLLESDLLEMHNVIQCQMEKSENLSSGALIGTKIVSNVIPLGKDIYQALLSDKTSGNYFIIKKEILEKCNPELKNYGKTYGNFFVLEDKRADPYLIKELIDLKLCPPRDEEYYQSLKEHVEKKPIKYLKLLPITANNFKQNLAIMVSLESNDNMDILKIGKKLLSFAPVEEKIVISEWLAAEGCNTKESMEKLFTQWVAGEKKQQTMQKNKKISLNREGNEKNL